MAEKFKISISAKLNTAESANTIKKQLADLEKELNLKITYDSKAFQNIKDNLNNIKTQVNQINNVSDIGAKKLVTSYHGAEENIENVFKIVEKTKVGVGQWKEITTNINKETGENSQILKVIKDDNEKIKLQKQEQLKLEKSIEQRKSKQVNIIDEQIKKREEEVKLFSSLLKEQMKSEVLEEKKIDGLREQIDLFKLQMLGDAERGFKGQVDILLGKVEKKFHSPLEEFRKDVESLNISMPDAEYRMKELAVRLSNIKLEASGAGSLLQRMVEGAFKFLRFYLVGGLLVGFIRNLREGVNGVIELDASLTEFNKVADVTISHLERLTGKAYEMGKEIGRTGKEVIDAATEFKRAGYEVEESFDLSRVALVLTNVGDGITNAKEAASSIIAVLRGFKMEASAATHIIDVLNEVSNNFAVDTNNLTEILKRTSGTLAQTGTTYEQLIGLATAGFESLRNASNVSSGILMISQRLRGMSEEGEVVKDLVPKIQKAFDKYTKGAVSIIDEQNGGLHSTYEILNQLSKVYHILSDEARAYINELIAGNRQSRVLISIMENWHTVQGAIEAATNSMGSAEEENKKYLESINGRLATLRSTMQMFWKNFIDSDLIKSVVSTLTTLANVLDTLVNNPLSKFLLTVGAITLSMGLLIKGLKVLKASWLGNAIAITAQNIALNGLLTTTIAYSKAFWASPLGKVAIVVAGIYAIVKAADALVISVEEQREKVESLTQTVSKLTDEIENLKQKDKLTSGEKEYLQYLEDRLVLEKELLKIETLRLVEKDVFGKGFSQTLLDKGLIREYGKALETLDKFENAIAFARRSMRPDKVFRSLREEALKTEKSILDIKDAVEDYINILGEDAPQQLIDFYNELNNGIEYVNLIKRELGVYTETIDENTKALKENIEEIKTLDDLVNLYESFQKEVDNTYKGLVSLSEAYRTVNNGEKLSFNTINDLIKQYPTLASYISQTNDLTFQRGEILKKVWDAERKIQTQRLQAQKRELEEELKLHEKTLARVDITAYMAGIDTPEMQEIRNQLRYVKALIELYDSEIASDILTFEEKKSKSEEYKAIADALYLYQKALDDVNAELERNNLLTEQAEGQDKINLLLKRVDLYKQQQKALHDINEARRRLISQDIGKLSGLGFDITYDPAANQLMINNMTKLESLYGNTAKEAEKLIKNILDMNRANVDASNQWWNVENAIRGTYETIAEINRKKVDELIKQEEERLEAIKSIEAKVVEMIRKGIEEEMKTRRKAHDEKIKQLNEELDLFKEVINEQIKALDEQEDQVAFEEQLAEKTKEKSDLQSRINQLMLDDSLAARNERMELEEQLADKEKEISEFLRKHNVDQRKKALNESLKLKEEEIKGRIDKENKELEQYELFQNQRLEKDRLYVEAHHLLMENSFEEIKTMIIDFEDRWGEGMTAAGDSIKDNIINNLQIVQDMLDDISARSASEALQSAYTRTERNISQAKTPSDNTSAIIEQMKKNSEAWHTASAEQKKQLEDANFILGSSMGWYRKGGVWYKPNGVRAYDTGGEAFGKGFLFKNTLEPERILSPEQTRDFNRLINYLPKITDYLPKFNISKLNFAGIGDIHLHIAKINDSIDIKNVAKEVVGEINNTFVRRGGRRLL